jgi:hypothetical protein
MPKVAFDYTYLFFRNLRLNYMAEEIAAKATFPILPPLAPWEETKDTLHLFIQIVGKIRLKLMPRKNHWWHVTLYVTPRGLSTAAMPYNGRTLQLDFDFIEHKLEISTCEGKHRDIPLFEGLTVAQFYEQVFAALQELNIKIKILAKPYDMKSKIPFAQDQEHHYYKPEIIQQYWHALVQIDQVFKKFSGRFYGKSSPVHLYWHSLDLTFYRFSGKKAPINPEASIVEKDAYSHEVISFGFWAGNELVPEATFFSYTFPLPAGIEKEPIKPAAAGWADYNGSPMALLTYENLLKEPDPKQALLDFLESTYQAGAKLANWPIEEFNVPSLEDL